MKIWTTTSCYVTGLEEPGYRPDLGGLEEDEDISYSMFKIDFPTSVLLRVAGPTAKLSALTPISDAEAAVFINAAGASLVNVDVPDRELDDIARSSGLDPSKIRREAKIDTPQALQSQETALALEIATKKGKTISAEDIAGMKAGKCSADDKVLHELQQEAAEL